MGYSIHAAKGFGWQTGLKIITAGITLLKAAALAHLLTPIDFGLFSLVMIALGLSEAATQTGINVTMLQSDKPVVHFINTAWVIAIIRGVLIGILIALIGVGMQWYYHQPELLPLVGMAALIPIIKGFINPAIISWRKEFNFATESWYYLALAIIDAALAIICGWWLRSAVALLLAIIGSAVFEVIISFVMIKLWPTFAYAREVGKEIMKGAKGLSLASLMGYLNDNLDDIVIRTLTNTYQLGIYHNAYALSHQVNYDVANSVQHGAFPVFTKISDDQSRLGKGFVKTILATTAIISLASIPLLLFPNLIVGLIFGEKWLAIVPLLPWLVVAGIVHSIALIGYTLLLARGSYTVLNIHQVVNLGLMIGLMAFFTNQFGLAGAVMGLALARVVALPIVMYGCYRTLKT